MTIIDMLEYLNSTEGLNIPLRTLSSRCGCANSTLSNYINRKSKPNEEMEQQLKFGIGSLIREMISEWRKVT